MRHPPFGDKLPHAEPAWYQSYYTPYYTYSHARYRDKVRAFVDTELAPHVHEWDESRTVPKEVFRKAFQAQILPAVVGPPWPSRYAGDGPDGFDCFHELIMLDEMARTASGGVAAGIIVGLAVGLPPILNFGSEYLKDTVASDCLRGEKFICLAISEPYAGSDVANLQTTARREGDFYVVNGEKKWITNAIWADYFTVAVRTGEPGMGGISLLLIERTMPGVKCKQMNCTGLWASGTTYVTFEDVRVPVSHLIGKENEGFKLIMVNFNHERWLMMIQALRFSRVCFSEAFHYAMKRETFGKKLIEHQAIRFKLAEMGRQIDAAQSEVEHITYQLTQMPKPEAMAQLASPIALCKVHVSRLFEFCAREAAQIFGGASYVRGGVGEKVERLYREVRGFAIPGGSEEIMLDFASRQELRIAKQSKL